MLATLCLWPFKFLIPCINYINSFHNTTNGRSKSPKSLFSHFHMSIILNPPPWDTGINPCQNKHRYLAFLLGHREMRKYQVMVNDLWPNMEILSMIWINETSPKMMNCWEAVKFIGFIYDLQNKMYFSQKESYSSIFQKHHSQVKKGRYLTTTKNLS